MVLLSFYKCRSSEGDTHTLPAVMHSEVVGTHSTCTPCTSMSQLVKLSLPNRLMRIISQTDVKL